MMKWRLHYWCWCYPNVRCVRQRGRVRVDHIFLSSIVTTFTGVAIVSANTMTANKNRTRRNFIGAVGAAGVTVAVTGCLENSDDSSDDLDNPNAEPLEDAGEPPEEHIEEFHILEIESIDNNEFEIRFENEGDRAADLVNYDVEFDLFGSKNQYTGTITGTTTSTDTILDAGAYGKIMFNATIDMTGISTFDIRVVCNGTSEAVFCST